MMDETCFVHELAMPRNFFMHSSPGMSSNCGEFVKISNWAKPAASDNMSQWQ